MSVRRLSTFNYDDAVPYVTGIAAGIVTGGEPFGRTNEAEKIAGIAGVGAVVAGVHSVEPGSADLILTNDSKVFLGLALPATSIAELDVMSIACADGVVGWTSGAAAITEVTIDAEQYKALKASISYDALVVTKGVTIAQAALVSSIPHQMSKGSVTVGAASTGIVKAQIKFSQPVIKYGDMDSGKGVGVKRHYTGMIRGDFDASGSFDCRTWYDSNVEDDEPTPGNLVITGNDGSNSIVITLTLSVGITTKYKFSYPDDNGVVIHRYEFEAPPNTISVGIA